MSSFQCLVTLPESMVAHFPQLEGRHAPDWFAANDPGRPIGSGGGTANLLFEAWKATGKGQSFAVWLRSRPKLVVHSGGQSRRLPAYASVGKALLPISVERGTVGQAFDQTLLDLQTAEMDDLFGRADSDSLVAIISGDALMRPRALPRTLPKADVVCLGFEAPAEAATVFGTFFTPWGKLGQIDFALQKPTVKQINSFAESHRCLVDAGVWFLSEAAVMALMSECGWDEASESFPNGIRKYDLYSEYGLALGLNPSKPVERLQGLTSALLAAGDDFYHFGTNRQLVEAVSKLQTGCSPVRSDLGFTTSAHRRLNQHALNCVFERTPDFDPAAKVWMENCWFREGSTFAGGNVVTNIPPLSFPLILPKGQCLDLVPIGEDQWCVRPYGFDDSFSGPAGGKDTKWMGKVLDSCLAIRGLSFEDAGISPATDIQEARLFPICDLSDISADRLAWLFGETSVSREVHAAWWLAAERVSAQALQSRANIGRLYKQRRELRDLSLETTLKNHTRSIFFSTDLEKAATQLAATKMAWDAHPLSETASPAQKLHERMFRSAVLRNRGDNGADRLEAEAFRVLHDVIVEADWLKTKFPQSTLLPDQIIWSRCPLRMDLAGGWTDTPPYSMLYGGRVVNVAIEIKGQPPVQVFGRVLKEPEIVLKSIDLGTEVRVSTYEDLKTDVGKQSEFSLAKTALALSGFTPQFVEHSESTLRKQLEAFGGGIELSMLAAVPKGSGMGTSSILSAAILSALSEMCGHCWSHQQIFDRVLASEQMLTSGGGWQDQVGGVMPGLKLVTTTPGIRQDISCNWLPEQVFASAISEGTALLYYTGITRVAHDVLKEIVRGMFLNSGSRLSTLREIGENTESLVQALQTRSYQGFGGAIRRSWVLNQQLDSGTNPPAVARLYNLIDDYAVGAKLLGAGGGGYLLILGKSVEASHRIKQVLELENRSSGARFVRMAVSQTGLEVSTS